MNDMKTTSLFRINLTAVLSAGFLSGVASIFGFTPLPLDDDGPEEDMKAINGDWISVGNYLRDAYENR